MHRPGAAFLALGVVGLALAAGGRWRLGSGRQGFRPSAPSSLRSEAETAELAIRFLEDRVKKDPKDFVALNRLAGYYLQRMRETGYLAYLQLASRAARTSLSVFPAELNVGALAALVRVEHESHDFARARDDAMRLLELVPDESYPYQLLGDALVELGAYDEAASAFREMTRRAGRSVNSEARLARLAVLHGELELAQRRYREALALAAELVPPSRETVAWCHWQLGESTFASGDYDSAEREYRSALTSFPDYFRALASLARVRAAQGDVSGAIDQYERVVRMIPEPVLVSELGDLYQLAGRAKEAAAQYELCERIGQLNAASGTLYNRQLALFYADHDLKLEEAHRLATDEYKVRRDVYGADSVAWTALKAGRVGEAQTAIGEALRLGTRDARMLYHAGMISRAAGSVGAARDYLNRALTVNPQFDVRQAAIARRALAADDMGSEGQLSKAPRPLD